MLMDREVFGEQGSRILINYVYLVHYSRNSEMILNTGTDLKDSAGSCIEVKFRGFVRGH